MDQVRINLENSNTSVVLRDPLHFGTEAFGASAQRPAAMAAFMHKKKIVLVIAWYVIMCPSCLCLPPPLESQSLPLCLMRFRLVLVPVSPVSTFLSPLLSLLCTLRRPYAIATIENVMEPHAQPPQDQWTQGQCDRWACR